MNHYMIWYFVCLAVTFFLAMSAAMIGEIDSGMEEPCQKMTAKQWAAYTVKAAILALVLSLVFPLMLFLYAVFAAMFLLSILTDDREYV